MKKVNTRSQKNCHESVTSFLCSASGFVLLTNRSLGEDIKPSKVMNIPHERVGIAFRPEGCPVKPDEPLPPAWIIIREGVVIPVPEPKDEVEFVEALNSPAFP